MIEKKLVQAKKEEYELKGFIRNWFGKGVISEVRTERTPIGEKIVILTSLPGLVIGSHGERIQELSDVLKKKFGLENPQVEVLDLEQPEFDAQTVADRLALSLERSGPLSFKHLAYRELEKLEKAGALGAEIRLSGKLPSEKAKSWRFAFGYLKKTGGLAGQIPAVKKASSTAFTKPGVIGIKVSIVPKGAKIEEIKRIEKS